MNKTRLIKYFIIGFFSLFISQFIVHGATFDCDTQITDGTDTGDCKALLDFYNSLDGPTWQMGGRDTDGAVCLWSGVTCNTDTPKRVIIIDFGSNGLNTVNLSGSFPASLSGLTEITNFKIEINNMQNLVGILPSEWGTWTKITNFYICDLNSENGFTSTNLTGALPTERSSWTSINNFQICRSQINGQLPVERSSRTGITTFLVRNSKLIGILNPQRSGWTKISTFDVSSNQITGVLPPERSSRTGITKFDVGSNQLTGSLPVERSSWTNISTFNIYVNDINGQLPSQRSSRTGMITFQASSNQLTGSLPPGRSGWTKISTFDVSSNQITGVLPPERSSRTNINNFNISSNGLNGILPSQRSSRTGISQFQLYSNKLRGTIPASWSGRTKSDLNFNVSYNALKGTLPTELINSRTGTRSLKQNCMKTGYYSPSDIILLDLHSTDWDNQRQCDADVYVSKSILTPGPWYPGDTVSYLINYFNSGPEDALDILIYDFTGSFLGLSSASIPYTSFATGRYFTGEDLESGSGRSFVVTGVIENIQMTTGVENVAYVTSYNIDSDLNNNLTGISEMVYDITAPTITGGSVTVTGDDADFDFDSDEGGTIIYSGSCGTGSPTVAIIGNNIVVFTGLADGIYSGCQIQVIDSSNNTGNRITIPEFLVDTTPPIDGPICTTGQYFSGTIFVECSVSETGAFVRFLTGGLDPTNSSAIRSDMSFDQTTNLKAIACDSLNNCNITNIENQTYTLDNTPPVTIISDTNSNWRSTGVYWTLTGSDAGIGLDQIYFKILDGDTSCNTGGFDIYTGEININANSGDVLQKTICFYGVDLLGNTEIINKQLYKIDMSSPFLSAPIIYSGIRNGIYFKGIISIQSTINESGAGILSDSCQKSTDSGLNRSLANQITGYCQYNDYSGFSDISIMFLANDEVGNTGISNQSNFIFDDIGPVLGTPEIYSGMVYSNYFKGTINIQATVSDTGSDIDNGTCRYSIDSGASRQSASYNGGYCQEYNLTPNTDINIIFEANDNLGTTGTSSTRSYIFDNIAPNTIDNSDTSRHNTDQTINLTATDTGAGVFQTYYCVVDDGDTCDPETEGTTGNTVVISVANGNMVQKKIFYYSVDNLNNRETTKQSNTIKIDKIGPTCSIVYNPSSITSGNVLATLTGCNEAVTITNNGGSDDYIFGSNGNFTFEFNDIAGNTGQTVATVTWIDNTAPILTGGATVVTNNTVTVSFTGTEGGTILFSGSCGVGTPSTASSGTNVITFGPLGNATYSNCEIQVVDSVGNGSNRLDVFDFTINVTPPPSGGGGGGGTTLRIDNCPNGDYSPSYYDRTCGESHGAGDTEINIVLQVDICPNGDYSPSKYDGKCNNPTDPFEIVTKYRIIHGYKNDGKTWLLEKNVTYNEMAKIIIRTLTTQKYQPSYSGKHRGTLYILDMKKMGIGDYTKINGDNFINTQELLDILIKGLKYQRKIDIHYTTPKLKSVSYIKRKDVLKFVVRLFLDKKLLETDSRLNDIERNKITIDKTLKLDDFQNLISEIEKKEKIK